MFYKLLFVLNLSISIFNCHIMFQSTVGMLRSEDAFRLGAEDTGLLLPERHYCVHIRQRLSAGLFGTVQGSVAEDWLVGLLPAGRGRY